MNTRTTTSKITIDAPADRVWAALTRPELVKQWQYGTDLSTDWHVGSPIVFRNEWEGKVFEQKGTILEIEPVRRVKYSLFFPHPGMEEDKPENYFTMTYILDEAAGQTTLTIIQDDPREQESQERSESQQAAEESENSILLSLKKLVEG